MLQHITDIARNNRCALYNELSHMTPYYLVANNPERINITSEVVFHINNLKLMSLYFDCILIPIENLLAFANIRNKTIIEKVVNHKQFAEMVDLGHISFCGWGGTTKSTLLRNSIEYALVDYKHLKSPSYMQKVETIIQKSHLYIREESLSDTGHDSIFINNISLLDTPQYGKDIARTINHINDFYLENNYIGSLEFYKWLDEQNYNQSLINSLYNVYYRSWQEYCYKYYSPLVTANSERVSYDLSEINVGTSLKTNNVLAMLYSPSIFLRFLKWQLGDDLVRKLLVISPTGIQSIRNGDGAWTRFKKSYHDCIEASSSIFWLKNEIAAEPDSFNTKNINIIINALFAKNRQLDSSFLMDIARITFDLISWTYKTFNPTTVLIVLLSRLFNSKSAIPFKKDAIDFYKKVKIIVKKQEFMYAV